MYLLDLLVNNDTDSMLGYVVNSSRFAMVALMGHTLLNGTCALERNHKVSLNIRLPCLIPKNISTKYILHAPAFYDKDEESLR